MWYVYNTNCWTMGRVTAEAVRVNWRGACITPIAVWWGGWQLRQYVWTAWCVYNTSCCTMKRMTTDNYECSNSRCIGQLSVVGKLCGRVLIKRVWDGTECAIANWGVATWFIRGRGCATQLFSMGQGRERYVVNGEHAFWAFIDSGI